MKRSRNVFTPKLMQECVKLVLEQHQSSVLANHPYKNGLANTVKNGKVSLLKYTESHQNNDAFNPIDMTIFDSS